MGALAASWSLAYSLLALGVGNELPKLFSQPVFELICQYLAL
jgi:hypothetical protein